VIHVSRPAIVLVAVVLGALALLGAALPPDGRAALVRTVVVVGGITLAALYLRRTRFATLSTPERFELELRRPVETPPVVTSLRAAEMMVRLSTASALDFDVRLRPVLRDLTRWRLLTNRGVDMDLKPDLARQAMGEALTSLVEDVEPPALGAPGVSLAAIDAGLDQLEQI
jgi:hypothetical protein